MRLIIAADKAVVPLDADRSEALERFAVNLEAARPARAPSLARPLGCRSRACLCRWRRPLLPPPTCCCCRSLGLPAG